MRAERVVIDLVNELKRHIDEARGTAKKPVFWLGAGCSTFDGIPTNAELLPRLLPACKNAPVPQVFFDRFCARAGDDGIRALELERHLNVELRDGSPYLSLARLLTAGVIDMVVSMNLDDLLEQALARLGQEPDHDYQLIDLARLGGDADGLRLAPTPRIKVVKLFGDCVTGHRALTTLRMPRHDAQIELLTRDYSRLPAVVCGYSFFHQPVAASFAGQAAPLYYIDKDYPESSFVRGLMSRRSRVTRFVDRRLGRFEEFLDFLCPVCLDDSGFVIKVTEVTPKGERRQKRKLRASP